MKKYELIETDSILILGRKLFRIKSLIDFNDVKEGDIGGYIEKYDNLSQKGDCWVCGDARVYGDASVYGDARVYGDAEISNKNDVSMISGFGTENRTTTFFKKKNGEVAVACGCFAGTLDEFVEQVKNTRTGYIADEYFDIANLMRKRFNNRSGEQK